MTVMESEMLSGDICMCKELLGPGLIVSFYPVCSRLTLAKEHNKQNILYGTLLRSIMRLV